MINIISNAKINIGLNILEKLPNGYHNLDMLMLPISLADEIKIEFKNSRGNLKIKSSDDTIPTDEKNIIYKIYNIFYEETKLEKQEIELYLEKNIPHEAGLGGGSSNGGVFLKELNKFHNDILKEEEMMKLGKKIGADIPFFIKNKPCRARGIGEDLEVIENNLDVDIILIKPKFGVSTAKAYSMFSQLENNKMADIEKLIEGLKLNDKSLVEKYNENILEQGLLISDENIKAFKKDLEKLEGLKFFMSGSGSCYYTLVDRNSTEEALKVLQERFYEAEVIKCSFI